MAFGNYAPFYRPNFYPMSQMPGQNIPDPSAQFNQPYQAAVQAPTVQMPIAQPSDDRIWVQGEAGAKAYFVAPNVTVVLWDTESPTIYIKSADATGKPLEMDIIDLSRRTKNTPAISPNSSTDHKCTCGDKFVLKKDFETLQGEISALRNELDEIKTKAKNIKNSVEEVENV